MSEQLLKELEESDFQSWKRHPISQLLFKFMADRAEDWMETAINKWQAGTMTLAEDHEFRHKIMMCQELNNLRLDDIKNFYGMLGKLK